MKEPNTTGPGPAAAAGCLALALVLAPAGAQDPYAEFKGNGVETFCRVPELTGLGALGSRTAAPGADSVELTDTQAAAAYDCARPAMAEGYARSGLEAARLYQNWRRFSTAPYLSRPHTRRYANNYANEIAAPYYGRYGDGGRLPVGSVIAKDSFAVNDRGRVVSGALALIEKMPEGCNPAVGDWRFVFVLPDGRLFGSTKAVDPYTVEFCQDCHQSAGPEQDYLFFLPPAYRTGAGR